MPTAKRHGARAGAPAPDEWDHRSRALGVNPSEDIVVELARRFLVARGDQALGLAPTRLLPPRKARTWILFWTAARRVDDSVERGERTVQEWRASLDDPGNATLADRCLGAFLRRPDAAGTRPEVRSWLERGLDGLERESYFDRPRAFREYLDLIHDKSAPAMLILDRLLFAGEPESALVGHAEAFAASTQIGDDCRDLPRDLKSGRCFVTLEELRGHGSVKALSASPAFAAGRSAVCALLLERADAAAARFRIPDHHQTARRLSALWSHAIASGQIKPTRSALRLPKTFEASPLPRTKPRAALRAVVDKRFPPS